MENWMGDLPSEISSRSLNMITIPGTHDSFTYAISSKSDVAVDLECYNCLRCCPCISKEISPWVRTQAMTLTQQLEAGIRYLDIRVGLRYMNASDLLASSSSKHYHESSKTPTKLYKRNWLNFRDHDFYLLHGLWANSFRDEMKAVAKFLRAHPKEVIIVDCNHFYNFTDIKYYYEWQNLALEIFVDLLMPRQEDIPTLDEIWAAGKQVLLFSVLDEKYADELLWTQAQIHSLWAETDHLSQLMSFLNDHIGIEKLDRDKTSFYVHQGILTPDCCYVTGHLGGKLRELARRAGKPFLNWIKGQKSTPGLHGFNIVIIDFALTDTPSYVASVVRKNYQDIKQPLKT